MNQQIRHQLDTVSKNLELLTDFCLRYDLPSEAFVFGFDNIPSVCFTDAVAAAKLFGKSDWLRERDRCCEKITYHWARTIDGVKVKLHQVEVQEDMNNTPVPTKAFPIQLEENVS